MSIALPTVLNTCRCKAAMVRETHSTELAEFSYRNHRLTVQDIAVRMAIVTTRFPLGDEKGTR